MNELIHNTVVIQTAKDDWQTQGRGTNDQEYQIYLDCANDGQGNEFMTGNPLKSYDEWASS